MTHPADAVPQEVPPAQYAPPVCRLMWDTIIETNAQTVLEIGTCAGDSARIFSTALKRTGGHLYSLDIVGARGDWMSTWDCSNITFLVGNSLDYSWDKALDVLYIDGGHTYTVALSDLTRFAPWVRVGGRILIHDTRLSGAEDGIRRAIYEWTAKTLLPWTEYPHWYGMGVIEVTVPLARC